MTRSTTVTLPAPVSPERARLRTRMTRPQRHRLQVEFPAGHLIRFEHNVAQHRGRIEKIIDIQNARGANLEF